jgi:hypothetical protein
MDGLFNIFELSVPLKDTSSSQVSNFKAFYLRSTAQVVVEDKGDVNISKFEKYLVDPFAAVRKPSEQITKIVDTVIVKTNGDLREVNMILQIHGYNTSDEEFYKTCENTAFKINEIHGRSEQLLIFFGYRWPSEKTSANGLLATMSRSILPLWLQIIGGFGILRLTIDAFNSIMNFSAFTHHAPRITDFLSIDNCVAMAGLDIAKWHILYVFLATFLVLFRCTAFVAVMIITLMLMRASGYFQDSYRAINYGVPDLVQFFRVFDYCIKKHPKAAEMKALEENRINLSFIAHSMGGFVTTNLIRILSDVFDNGGDQTLDVADESSRSYESISSHIGRFFTLDKMVLISPDIPVNTILLERSNFLVSSLIRFKESYLFSNQSDMVLLLFSTVANYLSFPSRTPQMGYRLGNLGVERGCIKRTWKQSFIVRLKVIKNRLFVNSEVHIENDKYTLEEFELINVHEPNPLPGVLTDLVIGVQRKKLSGNSREGLKKPFLAQKFTYFDCTDYLRKKARGKDNPENVNFEVLDLIDYIILLRHASFTHGGYFDQERCPETHEAIYRIACQGFEGLEKNETGQQILQGKHGIKVLRPANIPSYNNPHEGL